MDDDVQNCTQEQQRVNANNWRAANIWTDAMHMGSSNLLRRLINCSKQLNIMYPTLVGQFSTKEVVQVVAIAAMCASRS
ncbi:hypothetical protein YC2023_052142 [Brassica napus]